MTAKLDRFAAWLAEERLPQTAISVTSSGVQILEADTGTCPRCRRGKAEIMQRRLYPVYADESNWLLSCEECWQEMVDHYNDLWAEVCR